MTTTGATLPLSGVVKHAESLRQAGEFAQVQQLYQQVIEQRPDIHVGWTGLGQAQGSTRHSSIQPGIENGRTRSHDP